ncbi:trehalose-phosphatase, partial [Calditrichota bacterium]
SLTESLLKRHTLELHYFDGGIELRAAGRNKGFAVQTVLREQPFGTCAYLGDDLTDEDAFEVLKGKGLCVLVREEYRETKADVWIKPPDELIEFLDNWCNKLKQ